MSLALDPILEELALVADPALRFLRCMSHLYLRFDLGREHAEKFAKRGINGGNPQPLSFLFVGSDRSRCHVISRLGGPDSAAARKAINEAFGRLVEVIGDVPEIGVYPNTVDLESWHLDPGLLVEWVGANSKERPVTVKVLGTRGTTRSKAWLIDSGTAMDSGYNTWSSYDYKEFVLVGGLVGQSRLKNGRTTTMRSTRQMAISDIPKLTRLI